MKYCSARLLFVGFGIAMVSVAAAAESVMSELDDPAGNRKNVPILQGGGVVITPVPDHSVSIELLGSPTEQRVPVVGVSESVNTAASTDTDGVVILFAAIILLFQVGLIAWFIWVRNKSSSRDVATSMEEITGGPSPVAKAFIKDVHGYTRDPAIQIREKPLMVGRVAGADTRHTAYLVVNKGTVGRRHAIIEYKGDSFWIADQESVNGTFVNGERINEERQLKHGDKIKFHKYGFEFSQPETDDRPRQGAIEPDVTIVAGASTIMATTTMEADTSVADRSGGESLYTSGRGLAESDATDSASVTEIVDSSLFADDDDSNIKAADAMMSGFVGQSDIRFRDNETLDGTTGAMFESPLPESAIEDRVDEEEEDLGVEINLDTVGEEGHSSLILEEPIIQVNEDFDVDASAFFEEITVGPIPGEDVYHPVRADDEQLSFDATLDEATGARDAGARAEAANHDMEDVETTMTSKLPESDEANHMSDPFLDDTVMLQDSPLVGTSADEDEPEETIVSEAGSDSTILRKDRRF